MKVYKAASRIRLLMISKAYGFNFYNFYNFSNSQL